MWNLRNKTDEHRGKDGKIFIMQMESKRELKYQYLYWTNDFKTKSMKQYKEGHYIHQEGITIVTIYAPNITAPKYVKQLITNIKEEIDGNTISRRL